MAFNGESLVTIEPPHNSNGVIITYYSLTTEGCQFGWSQLIGKEVDEYDVTPLIKSIEFIYNNAKCELFDRHIHRTRKIFKCTICEDFKLQFQQANTEGLENK